MTQYHSFDAKLSNSQLNNLKSATKNVTDETLRCKTSNIIGTNETA